MAIDDIALDTSIFVQVFRNDQSMKDRIKGIKHVWIPAPVIGEIMIGFYRMRRPSTQRGKFERFVTRSTVIACDRAVAGKYGEIAADLRGRGAMIPVNDAWIAACCLVHNKTLATRDAHFQNVPGLPVEMW